METATFDINHGQVLVFTVELDADKGSPLLSRDEAFVAQVKDVVCASVGKVDPAHLFVKLSRAETDEALTFAAVHTREALPEFNAGECVMAVEVVLPPRRSRSRKAFAHACTALAYYDGVTCLHTIFNVLEAFESGVSAGDAAKLSAYPFTGRNDATYGVGNAVNLIGQIGNVFGAAVGSLLNVYNGAFWTSDDTWRPTPLMLLKKLPEREMLRYNSVPEATTFHQIMDAIEEARIASGCSKAVGTINFSPTVSLGIAPSFEAFKGPAGRKRYMTTPLGPPPPGGGFELVFNGLFLNNYGRHNPSGLKAKVVDVLWDWPSLGNHFGPLVWVAQIQGKFQLQVQSPQCLTATLEGIFGPIAGPSVRSAKAKLTGQVATVT